MAIVVASLSLHAALASGRMHRSCSVSSSPSLRRSAPLLVQTNPEFWQPHDDEKHPNEAPGTGQPRVEAGASFGLLRGRRLPRRELASEWIDAGVPKWVTLIDEALFVLARTIPPTHIHFCMHARRARTLHGFYQSSELIRAYTCKPTKKLHELCASPPGLQASAMFVRGSLDFYPGVSAARYLEGCQLYVVGSTIYLLLALFAAHEVLYMQFYRDRLNLG